MEKLFSMFPEHGFNWHYCDTLMEFGETCSVAGGQIINTEPAEFVVDDAEVVSLEEYEKCPHEGFGVEEV